jgi:hypothetical protein
MRSRAKAVYGAGVQPVLDGQSRGKVSALTRGDLSPCPIGNPGREARLRRQGSAEGIVPAKPVKPVGSDQRAERSPARDKGKPGAELPALGSLGWEAIWERQNLSTALKRVESNRGAPGVDGMRVEALRPYLKDHWPEVRETLESGRYRPSPALRVEIPKPEGDVRELGIPTVLDRLLQQAIAQVLTPQLRVSARAERTRRREAGPGVCPGGL